MTITTNTSQQYGGGTVASMIRNNGWVPGKTVVRINDPSLKTHNRIGVINYIPGNVWDFLVSFDDGESAVSRYTRNRLTDGTVVEHHAVIEDVKAPKFKSTSFYPSDILKLALREHVIATAHLDENTKYVVPCLSTATDILPNCYEFTERRCDPVAINEKDFIAAINSHPDMAYTLYGDINDIIDHIYDQANDIIFVNGYFICSTPIDVGGPGNMLNIKYDIIPA